MLVLMLRFYLPLLRIDLYVDVGDGICVCVVDVGDDVKVLPPLLRIDSRQQDPMENLSKLVKGQGRVHQKGSGGEPTYLFTKEAGWSPCKQKCSAKSSFLRFPSL